MAGDLNSDSHDVGTRSTGGEVACEALHGGSVQRRHRRAAEEGQYVATECDLVAESGLRLQVTQQAEPLVGPLSERDLAKAGVKPVASGFVGLDCGRESNGVRLSGEVARPLTSVGSR